jgi:hypothetical protein
MTPMRAFVAVLLLCAAAAAQSTPAPADHVLANDRLTLTIRPLGGAIGSVVLADDPEKLNPLHSLGHFVCVDGFGGTSAEERRAGLPSHGEANRVPWEVVSQGRQGNTLTVAFSANLPLVHEILRRTVRLVDGENVIYVDSEIESLLAFDRPINWGEHATIGPPFLELGRTSVEMSARRAMTRSHESQSAIPPHRLASFKEFAWPMAPGLDGRAIDVRPAPAMAPVGDHTTSLMDPARRLVFVTAFNAARRLLVGYVFRRAEYPWTQLWEHYPANGRLARGMEFAVQPFDMPRRDVIQQNTLLGAPTYRWLPARSRLSSSFLMFYTRTPEGLMQVDDVTLEGERLTIVDRASGRSLTLAASRPL